MKWRLTKNKKIKETLVGLKYKIIYEDLQTFFQTYMHTYICRKYRYEGGEIAKLQTGNQFHVFKGTQEQIAQQ